jgi:hypothetical protein
LIRRLLLLLSGSLAFWVLVGIPARLLGGDAALAYSGTALLLCLVPAVVTLVWAGQALKGTVDQQLLLVLGGTGVRLFTVLGAAWLLDAWVPYYRLYAGFWLWVLVAYLFTLALEITLLLAGSCHKPEAPAKGPSLETK